MLDFDKFMEKIASMSQEELKNIIYTSLDASGVEYKKGNNTIIFDSLYDYDNYICQNYLDDFEVNLNTRKDNNNKYNLDELLFVA